MIVFVFCPDTDDSIPMTFEDVEDVHLLADFYMFSSQVDGEQDLLEEAGLKKNPTTKHVATNSHHQALNGLTTTTTLNGTTTVHVLGGVIKQEPGRLVINGGSMVTTGGGEAAAVRPGNQLPQISLGFPLLASTVDSDSEVFFSCDMCNAKLKNKRNFETHMKRHRGELPFKCDECPKTFQGRRDLDTHKRSRHDPAKRGRMDIEMSPVSSSKSETVPSPSLFVFSTTEPAKTDGISMNGLTEGLMSGT